MFKIFFKKNQLTLSSYSVTEKTDEKSKLHGIASSNSAFQSFAEFQNEFWSLLLQTPPQWIFCKGQILKFHNEVW